MIQVRDDNGLMENGSIGDGDKWLDSRRILKVEFTGLDRSRREKEKSRIKMMGEVLF